MYMKFWTIDYIGEVSELAKISWNLSASDLSFLSYVKLMWKLTSLKFKHNVEDSQVIR